MRTEPRLWVEKLWILDSLEALEPLQTIPLERGLNLILSEPSTGSTSHGVGKSAFCQLLRFVLEDAQWATGTPLRDELLHSFPDGAAAARVHVGGEVWTVVKPWRHQRHYRAARGTDWPAVARDEVPNEYKAYVSALNQKLVNILPVKKLPGSGQSIQWQHILAWCSRDQECRYLGYFRWRVEGSGFSLPAQSPSLMVQIVLGLLDNVLILDRLKRLDGDIEKAQTKVAELKRRPEDLLNHVKHRLARALDQPADSPFRAADMFRPDALYGVAKQRINNIELELERAKQEQSRIERQRESLISERAPLDERAAVLDNEIRRLEASITGDTEEIERIQNESESLKAHFPTMCEYGDRLVGECKYVQKRVESVSIDDVRDANLRKANIRGWRQELTRLRKRVADIKKQIQPLNDRLNAMASSLEQVRDRRVAAVSSRRELEAAVADYELYEGVMVGRSEWPELKWAEDELEKLTHERDKLSLQRSRQSVKGADRQKAIESALDSAAKQLPGFSWAVFQKDEARPFRMGPPHSAALAVLETLVGDFICLADSRYPESFHPGFLLHDSPREAEMSESLFWKFLNAAQDCGDSVQYIVTTSTRAPDDFQQYIRLKLSNSRDDSLLFREKIGQEQLSQ